jgi:protein SCO1/2
MNQSHSTRFLSVGILQIALCAGTTSHAENPPQIIRDVGIDQRLNKPLPLELAFKDEAGQPVHLRDYFDNRPVILVLAYYRCPMLCTQVLNGVVKSLRDIDLEMGKDYRIVTVSFDPREGPELAARKKETYTAAYARPGADVGWHFLTGEQTPIAQLASATGFRYVYDPNLDQFAHASGIMVVTPDGKLSHYFLGIDYPPRDLRLALIEASRGRIGSRVDQLILLCYHFDPITGKYSASVMMLVRVVAVIMMLCLGVPVGRSWLRDWKKGRSQTSTIAT